MLDAVPPTLPWGAIQGTQEAVLTHYCLPIQKTVLEQKKNASLWAMLPLEMLGTTKGAYDRRNDLILRPSCG